jgi:hypothetical protein
MDLTAQESYSDENLSVHETPCSGCGSTIVFHSILMKPLSLYLENYDEMIRDTNREIDYFYCGICSRKFYTISKIIKIFTMRKS